MIKLHELRLNNFISLSDRYISVYPDGGKVKAINLSKQYITVKTNGFNLNLEENDIDGIPINESILKSFGVGIHRQEFVNQENYVWSVFLNDIQIIGTTYNSYVVIQLCDLILNIKYIHQLQNLYFNLYNEELNIKQ